VHRRVVHLGFALQVAVFVTKRVSPVLGDVSANSHQLRGKTVPGIKATFMQKESRSQISVERAFSSPS